MEMMKKERYLKSNIDNKKVEKKSYQIVRSKGPIMPKEDEPTGIIAPLKEKISQLISLLSPANIVKQVHKIEQSCKRHF